MNATELKAYAIANDYKKIGKIKASRETGYRFITLLRPNDPEGALNIWFSKNASAKLDELGLKVGDKVNHLIDDMSIIETVNAAGEPRLKVSFGGDEYDDIF